MGVTEGLVAEKDRGERLIVLQLALKKIRITFNYQPNEHLRILRPPLPYETAERKRSLPFCGPLSDPVGEPIFSFYFCIGSFYLRDLKDISV